MKVKAKHWLNVGGVWHGTGEEFEVKSIAGFEDSVEVVAEPKAVEQPKETPEKETTGTPAPKRRGRTVK